MNLAGPGFLKGTRLRGLFLCACGLFSLPVGAWAQDSPAQNPPAAANPAPPAKSDQPAPSTAPDDYKPSLLKKPKPAAAPQPNAPEGSVAVPNPANSPAPGGQSQTAPNSTNTPATVPPPAPASGNIAPSDSAPATSSTVTSSASSSTQTGSASPPPIPASPSATTSGTPSAENSSATPVAQPAGDSVPEMTTRTSQIPLESHVNLVPVRVVVHDARGNVVSDLREADFEIRQDGKPQVISHFSMETPASLEAQVVRGTAADKLEDTTQGASAKAGGEITLPSRFVALVVDDAHLNVSDLTRLRVAAIRYVDQSVKPNERIALFTVSGQSQVDFTDDHAKIVSQLKVLIPRPVGAYDPDNNLDCLKITYYQADQIQNKNDQLANSAALADALTCAAAENIPAQTAASTAASMVASTVQEVLQAGNLSTQYSLRRLNEIVRRISAMPGQRSMVLISSGFLTSTYEYEVSDVIDRATRQNVFINALDARGLYTVDPLGDITQSAPLRANAATTGLSLQYRVQEQQAQSEVLSYLSASTGGFYFRSNNDLGAGLVQTAAEPAVSYLLAFVPSGVKNDGKFHSITVKLLTKDHYTIQARRGFFAPKHGKTPEELAKQDIEDAVFSQEEQQGLPVQLHLQFFKVDATNAKLSVLTHVDIAQVQFDHSDGRNTDDLTIVAALFDRNGNFISADEKTLQMRLKDSTLDKLHQSGVTVKTNFDVKPGGYLVRLVVRDTKASQLSSRNGVVEIP